MKIYKCFTFDAAHWLPNVPQSHKCHGMHGHTYHVLIECAGRVGLESGWVIDYADVAKAWASLADILDHRVLNEIKGLENSTCENLARWIWDRLVLAGLPLSAIEIGETATAGVRYEGD